MKDYPVPDPRWYDPVILWGWRMAASGLVPARWFRRPLPDASQRTARTGRLHVEVVSHCWRYSHFLVYQLSSLVQFPPQQGQVTMTVYYCPEDEKTADLLAWFATQDVPGVTWNWCARPKQALFRRAIGRNEAALASKADWVWFTDCDLMFRERCLDALNELLQGRRDALVYPRTERTTPLLADQDPMLNADVDAERIAQVDDSRFTEHERSRATGPLQICHGDVARAVGYCADLTYYQRPSPVWCKAHEDRAFRWLLETQGTPLDIPGVYRIRHESKGRYTGSGWNTRLRGAIRRLALRFKEGDTKSDKAGK